MNVMVTDLSRDLDTTVQGIQVAITLFLLVMAALMIPGGKLAVRHRCAPPVQNTGRGWRDRDSNTTRHPTARVSSLCGSARRYLGMALSSSATLKFSSLALPFTNMTFHALWPSSTV